MLLANAASPDTRAAISASRLACALPKSVAMPSRSLAAAWSADTRASLSCVTLALIDWFVAS